MSCSKWRWTPECDTHICVGDCDNCNYNKDEEEWHTEVKNDGTDSRP